MTTNNIGFISKMFVVSITYLFIILIANFNLLDLTYLLFVISCFARFIYIRNNHEIKEWQTFFFSL